MVNYIDTVISTLLHYFQCFNSIAKIQKYFQWINKRIISVYLSIISVYLSFPMLQNHCNFASANRDKNNQNKSNETVAQTNKK